MNAQEMLSFADELQKNAAAPQLLQRIWQSGAGRAIAGGLVGGGIGAATSSPETRQRGFLRGALLGAGGGYAAPLLTSAGRSGAADAVKRWYQVQKHGLIGKGPLPVAKSVSREERLKIRDAQRKGLTSIPGILKGLRDKPREVLRQTWDNAGGLGKALAVGDVAMSVPHVVDPTTEKGYGEKALGMLGSSGGYLLGGRLGIVPGMLFAAGTGALGRAIGKPIDTLTGYKPHSRKGVTMAEHTPLQEAATGNLEPAAGALLPAPRPTTAFLKSQAAPVVGQLVNAAR